VAGTCVKLLFDRSIAFSFLHSTPCDQ
jgi:hypothetical protein